MIKKILLGLALTTGLMMANTAKDDLLSLATMGKTAGTALEMNKSDMEKADGGWYSYGSRYTPSSNSNYRTDPYLNMLSNYNTRNSSSHSRTSNYNAYYTYVKVRLYNNSMALRYLYR